MARVLFAAPMDAERRAVVARMAAGTFEPVILEDLTVEKRDDAWATADVVVCMGFPRELPRDLRERARKLRMVQALVAGVDHLPFDRLPPSAIVCSNAGAYNVSVAEHAMALLLAAAKDIPARTDEIRRAIFRQSAMNKAIAGSTVLVLGTGGIGSEVARLCRAFDARVIDVGRNASRVSAAADSGALDDLPGLLPRADAVVIALPLTRATAGLVDRKFLASMKDDAILVNVARGKIVVEDDLFDHLKAHPGFRAALDVWWTYPGGESGRPFHRPLHELPNVVMTPHNASGVPSQRRRAMEAAIDNVSRFLRGERPRNEVDRTEYARRETAAGRT